MMDNPNAPKFEGVARLIAGGSPPPFLATVLAEVAGGINAGALEEKRLPSADDARDRLDQVKKASRVLARYLRDPHTVGRLDRAAPQEDDGPQPVDISSDKLGWLRDLATRSDAAKAAVTAEDGRPAWPSPEGLLADQLCALIVARLWQAVRGKPAGPQSGKVSKACDAMWEACGQEPLGVDEGIWRRRLKFARQLLDDPALAASESPNSPERQMHQRMVAFCSEAAGRIAAYAKRKADQDRVAKVQARVERERAEQEHVAQPRTKP